MVELGILCLCCNLGNSNHSILAPAGAAALPSRIINHLPAHQLTSPNKRKKSVAISLAAKSAGFSINSVLKRCKKCGGKGCIDCPGCKGTGRNRKNGNIFERWKCFECQGFGLKSCPECGKGGLTPEQRGER